MFVAETIKNRDPVDKTAALLEETSNSMAAAEARVLLSSDQSLDPRIILVCSSAHGMSTHPEVKSHLMSVQVLVHSTDVESLSAPPYIVEGESCQISIRVLILSDPAMRRWRRCGAQTISAPPRC